MPLVFYVLHIVQCNKPTTILHSECDTYSNNNHDHINADPFVYIIYALMNATSVLLLEASRGNNSRIILADDDIRAVVCPFEIIIIFIGEVEPLYMN